MDETKVIEFEGTQVMNTPYNVPVKWQIGNADFHRITGIGHKEGLADPFIYPANLFPHHNGRVRVRIEITPLEE